MPQNVLKTSKNVLLFFCFFLAVYLPPTTSYANNSHDLTKSVIKGMPLRTLGPAFVGGRISHITVHPQDSRIWYIAVGSGGVWKTTNAGTTFEPMFDDQGSYSIGTLTIDPNNPDTIWVGTGENVSGRHVAWGDGIYKSRDGGKTWKNMGLKGTQHISRIIVHPKDSNKLLVAAEGPLWNKGGERGVYMTEDGGESWQRVLHTDDATGATDVLFHPSNPDVVYAATYERRRTVWSFLAGGPGSGIHKSTDGGFTWREVTKGLPSADSKIAIGKIGLAVTPADPTRVYATIEASDDKQGFYASTDQGESWSKKNSYISGGTGPHYYQEIYASPSNANRVYQADVFLHRTNDSGTNFDIVSDGRQLHSDKHALWINPKDDRHLLVGTDAGLYESFDMGETFKFFSNLPINQYYKVAASNHEPFYEILAGAQDLGTIRGPSRTTSIEGVRGRDWDVPLGADGYGVAYDPWDKDILYQMWQNGNLARFHAAAYENVMIKPQPHPNDPAERWNWDAPIEVSTSVEGRLYYGSQRVWRSDDRGNSWTPISGDLTTNTNRFELPLAGRKRSVNSLLDLGAMSRYATLTAISESVVDNKRIWTGSDDGLVHLSSDGGESWQRIKVRGLPERAYINDIEASQHKANAAFVVADNHKTGDFAPYVFATDNNGRSWRNISGNLAKDVIVWAIQQDAVEPGLLFLGAEDGLYVSLNDGQRWDKLSGAPVISFRDVKIQRRDLDVVGATFGRGIYVLDDYTPLRELAADIRKKTTSNDSSILFSSRDTWWYIPGVPGQAVGLPTLGSADWRASNPPHGAVFTVRLANVPKSPLELRREREREIEKDGNDVDFPGWDKLQAERRAGETRYYIDISDNNGTVIRRLSLPAENGTHRVAWDMRGAPPGAVTLKKPAFRPPWHSDPQGALYPPGNYQAQLIKVGPDSIDKIGAARSFKLKLLDTLSADSDLQNTTQFQRDYVTTANRLTAVNGTLKLMEERIKYIRKAIDETPSATLTLHQSLDALSVEIDKIRSVLYGNQSKQALSEFTTPGIASRIYTAGAALGTRVGPTQTQRDNLQIGEQAIGEIEAKVSELQNVRLKAIEQAISDADGPWTPGQSVGFN